MNFSNMHIKDSNNLNTPTRSGGPFGHEYDMQRDGFKSLSFGSGFSNNRMETIYEEKVRPTFVSKQEFCARPVNQMVPEKIQYVDNKQSVVFIKSNKTRSPSKVDVPVVSVSMRIKEASDIPTHILEDLKQWRAKVVKEAIQKEKYPNKNVLLKLLSRANLAYTLKKKIANSMFSDIRKGIQNKKYQQINQSLQNVQFIQ